MYVKSTFLNGDL
jgi:hypothetical protein